MIAFRYLEGQLKKRWSERKLALWAKELDTCVSRGEMEPIKAYFDTIYQVLIKETDEKRKRVEQCCRSMEITWAWVDHRQWDSYLPYILPYQYRDAGDLMISAFMLQAGRVQKKRVDRFAVVLNCVERGTAKEKQSPAYILALYLAFMCVHQNASNKPALSSVYEQLYRIRWGWLAPPRSKMEYFKNLLDTMLLCYGEAYTYNPADFITRYSLEKLMPHYISLLEQMPSTMEAVRKSRQKGDD